jgi:hypothetical protein
VSVSRLAVDPVEPTRAAIAWSDPWSRCLRRNVSQGCLSLRLGTHEGLSAARTRGVRLGLPPALSSKQIHQARQLLTRPENSVASIARLLGVSHSTLYAHVPGLAGGRISPEAIGSDPETAFDREVRRH